MTDSGPRKIGVSIELKPHAYDPMTNPELFEGVLARRCIAFLIDVVIIFIHIINCKISDIRRKFGSHCSSNMFVACIVNSETMRFAVGRFELESKEVFIMASRK